MGFHIMLIGFFVNLTQARVIWNKEPSEEERPPSDWPIGKLWSIFLINDCCGRLSLLLTVLPLDR